MTIQKIGVRWRGGTLKKYPRQVEALNNGQLILALLGPFWGALFAPLFLILGPWAKPLGGPWLCHYYSYEVIFLSNNTSQRVKTTNLFYNY